jgi:hypothetical protein
MSGLGDICTTVGLDRDLVRIWSILPYAHAFVSLGWGSVAEERFSGFDQKQVGVFPIAPSFFVAEVPVDGPSRQRRRRRRD